jgi:hypothetical protein
MNPQENRGIYPLRRARCSGLIQPPYGGIFFVRSTYPLALGPRRFGQKPLFCGIFRNQLRLNLPSRTSSQI